jgi:hypothetical protein
LGVAGGVKTRADHRDFLYRLPGTETRPVRWQPMETDIGKNFPSDPSFFDLGQPRHDNVVGFTNVALRCQIRRSPNIEKDTV